MFHCALLNSLGALISSPRKLKLDTIAAENGEIALAIQTKAKLIFFYILTAKLFTS